MEIKIKIITFRFCDFYVKLQQANHNSIEEMMMVDTVSPTPQPSTSNSPDEEDGFRGFSTQAPRKQQDEEMEFEPAVLAEMDQPFSNIPVASNHQITPATAPTANILMWMMRQQDLRVLEHAERRRKDERIAKLVNHLLERN